MGRPTTTSFQAPLSKYHLKRDRQKGSSSDREAWQIQKDALKTKFCAEGWAPRKRLSPDALEGIRALHAQFPEKYTTPVLADQFEVSAEAIRRILKSKWRPNDEETVSRRTRWDKRGERIWSKMVALGVKPPKKWRESPEVAAELADEGENVECVITFKNMAPVVDSKPPAPQVRNNDTAHELRKDTNSASSVYQTNAYTSLLSSNVNSRKGHQNTTSLNRLDGQTTGAPGATTPSYRQPDHAITSGRHKRSVSIVSIGGIAPSPANKRHGVPTSRRPGRGHGRAASLQLLPGRSTTSIKAPTSAMRSSQTSTSTQRSRESSQDDCGGTVPAIHRSPTRPVPGITATFHEPAMEPAISPTLPSVRQSITPAPGLSDAPKMPPSQSSLIRTVTQTKGESTDGPFSSRIKLRPLTHDQPSQVLDARSYLAQVFSSASNEGTPRSSTDLYSISNDSSDTLASEYLHPDIGDTSHHSIHGQQRSHPLPSRSHRTPEILMMGFGNIAGNFSLDPSLVNSSQFDEVKYKAVIGNQGGGGVVRAGSMRRQNGLLGSFGWNALGASLGDLLAGNEISSIKEATKRHDAKWFPILSTPQSLLFTDMRLEPGESQSYSFTYRLPPGLPPTHKGKALKVCYSIIIGIQRAAQLTQRHLVQSVDFPFRVLPSIDGHGAIMSHDLMSPCVILDSEPLIVPLKDFKSGAVAARKSSSHPAFDHREQDFFSYINQLLDKPGHEPSGGLLSPSTTEATKIERAVEEPATVESAITLAIQRSNFSAPSKLSANRFEITRSGHQMAVIMLARPAYRLGEVVPITVDFGKSDVQCYSLCVTLESSERIDATIALRSQASISRISRRVHAIQHRACVSADRIFLSLAIPNASTPEFITSGISLYWCLRCEFVTGAQEEGERENNGNGHSLLEEVGKDERGSVSAAIQAMPCETFDVQLPLRVYGDKKSLDDCFSIQERAI
ncbi:MAG: hypothetical protein Q9184_007481 [Pyrenodesmia sp. 2 TL-2023]